MSHHRRKRLVASLAILTTAIGLTAPSSASAVGQSQPIAFQFNGAQAPKKVFTTGTVICDECYPDLLAGGEEVAIGMLAEATLEMEYHATAVGDVGYDDALLRQGSEMPVTTELSTGPGSVHTTWTFVYDTGVFAKNDQNQWVGLLDLSGVPDVTFEQDISCSMPVDGSISCASPVLSFPILEIPVVPELITIGMNFNVNMMLDVDTDGAVAVRTLDVVGGPAGSAQQQIALTGSPATTVDAATIGCDEPVGGTATYGITSPVLPTKSALGIGASLDIEFDAGVSTNLGTLWSSGTITSTPLPDLDLTAADASVQLGALGADNLPPTVTGITQYSGVEGSPIAMAVTAEDNCGAPAVAWAYSDGGSAYGASVLHTFADDGNYSMMITASDQAGNSDTLLAHADVFNAAPVAEAGPNHTTAWGRPVVFGGAAIDPSSVDQTSLVSSWNFGDGSPSASGGAQVVHTYDQPGTYVSTYTACDKNGACGSDTRTVTVTRRATDVTVAQPAQATFGTPTQLVADVADQFGQPVPNRLVTFRIDGDVVGTASTNASGVATLGHTPQVVAGPHTVTASTAQDAKYEATTSAGHVMQVARKATQVHYTGATTGKPNKDVSLSATLTDATGTPLAGRTVEFQLGSQSTTATTDANGQAITSLKLTQKNGTYTVTATWIPDGGDADRYTSSAAGATFKLQTR